MVIITTMPKSHLIVNRLTSTTAASASADPIAAGRLRPARDFFFFGSAGLSLKIRPLAVLLLCASRLRQYAQPACEWNHLAASQPGAHHLRRPRLPFASYRVDL